MPLYPTWGEIAVRLALTMLAGAVIGFDRGSRGHAAGFRTTILVGLAASVAMIEANVLLSVSGKTASSFGVMDLMRFPLGILTGVGFIGGGVIFRRGDLVTGVTTAATMWTITVIGLCFGGGLLALGTVATALAFATLSGLSWIDKRIPRERRALIVIESDQAQDLDFPDTIAALGYRALLLRQSRAIDPSQVELCYEISWKQPELAGTPTDLLKAFDQKFPVVSFELTSEARH
ncbi:MAG: MgtC/SapB family protein [Acetobacteraceae bacterium]